MNIDTNTPVAELCERLREICVGKYLLCDDRLYLSEAADRLELLSIDNEDLRNQNHNNRVASDARWDRIQRLEKAGDDLYFGWGSERNNKDKYLENWKQAKEDKP